MGCKPSNVRNENQRELFNEDVDIKHRFLTGIHISKGAEGLEGNVQIAFGTTRKKKYERVAEGPSQTQTDVEDTVQDALEPT